MKNIISLFTIFSLGGCSILSGYRTNLNIQTSQDDAQIYIAKEL